MSKNIYALILTLVVSTLVLSACIPGQNKEAKSDEAMEGGMVAQNKDGSFTGNLKGLMGLGKAQKCTWTGEEGMAGTVYTDGTRSYFEATGIPAMGMESDSEEIGSVYGIDDGEYIYTWSSTSDEGMKMKNDQEDLEEEAMEEHDDYESDTHNEEMAYDSMANYDYEYRCDGWGIDESMFVPPTNISFKDLDKMMESMKEGLKGMESMCEMLEGEEKAECLKNFAEI